MTKPVVAIFGDIKHRPAEVDNRHTIGHWEGDTVFKDHKQSGLVTLVERRSGYLLAARLPMISAELTKAAMIRLLKPRRGAVKTITLDNGSEFASHKAVAKGTDFRQVTDAEVRRVVEKLNDRPRKRLGYRTPAKVFLGSTQEH